MSRVFNLDDYRIEEELQDEDQVLQCPCGSVDFSIRQDFKVFCGECRSLSMELAIDQDVLDQLLSEDE
jgi:ferredoxin-thioredoxin reductase catalytic subunit